MPGVSSFAPSSEHRPASRLALMDQLCRILSDQEETCQQLAACAQEQQTALREGKGSDFVRASLTQAHLARRLFFLEEERGAAVEALAHALSESSAPSSLSTLMERLPEADSARLAARSRDLQQSADRASVLQKVNAQMIQTNIQLAAALSRQHIDPASRYYGGAQVASELPASQLDRRI
ncbi:MAG: flagellar export chaperone FlgN [Caldilineaceae bacterium]|nr:flagellar export chaperone FlgN [Caldilineaceae bacterium]HRJ41798.1 flagellar export chaperone FlgN [Caldilineaceae bacterium]